MFFATLCYKTKPLLIRKIGLKPYPIDVWGIFCYFFKLLLAQKTFFA